MRISSIRIQNFRAFKDETAHFGGYVCLAGPNGTGKSTVLNALNVVFRNTEDSATNLLTLTEEDFHQKDTSSPIVITVTFEELSKSAQEDFKGYFRQNRLIISAVAKWDAKSRTAPVLQYGERLGIKNFADFFQAEGDSAKVDDLKSRYEIIRIIHSTLPPPGTKQKMVDALRDYEDAHPDECVPLQSADQFYGISKGKNLLQKYVQWVFVPAVKDASSEQLEARSTALAQILERTMRAKMSFSGPIESLRADAILKYNEVLALHENALKALSTALSTRIQEWAHPDASVNLKWFSEAAKAVVLAEPIAQVFVREGSFQGQLGRFGHGLQRSFLLALLQELASSDSKDAPTLILACEEPELYQHPPQIRHLAAILAQLIDKGSQVLVCTHSSHFVRGEAFEDIRMVRRNLQNGEVKIRSAEFEQYAGLIAAAQGKKPLKRAGTALKVAQTLQPAMNEMFFTTILILAEGIEDAAYIQSYISLLDLWDEYRRLGCHIVSPYRGKGNIHQPLAIARLLEIPTFVVFDGDSGSCNNASARIKHEIDNATLLRLCGDTSTASIPSQNVWGKTFVMWKDTIASALEEDIGHEGWLNLQDNVKVHLGMLDTKDVDKNPLFIGEMLAIAWDDGLRFPSLERLCKAILEFASANTQLKKAMTS